MTALLLARAQFAFTVSFHFLFPAFSISLASFLAVLEALWLKTGRVAAEPRVQCRRKQKEACVVRGTHHSTCYRNGGKCVFGQH